MSKEIDGTEFACLTINAFMEEENKELNQKIADLEVKLEQYEKFMKDNEWDSIEEMQTTLNECEKKYFDMQQQLAEKEKEIKELTLLHFGDEVNEPVLTTTRIINQAKTDFAIEQLKKVKDKVLQETERIIDEVYLDFEAGFESCYIFMLNQINQQIKELKEGK